MHGIALYVNRAAEADSENPFNVQTHCNTCGIVIMITTIVVKCIVATFLVRY